MNYLLNGTFKIEKSTWQWFALLRFLLAVIVMCSHIRLFLNSNVESNFTQYIGLLGGKAAVGGFLVISGISIGLSYFKNEKGYLKRRFLRIYPLYFWAVIMAIILPYIIETPYTGSKITWVGAGFLTNLGNLMLLQNFIVIPTPLNGPLWSISIEFFYYLLVPMLFCKLKLRHLYQVIIASAVYYCLTYQIFNYNVLYGNIAMIYAWIWIIGYCAVKGAKNYINILFILFGSAAIFYNDSIMQEKASFLTFLITCSFVLFGNSIFKMTLYPVLKRTFDYLGEISYPIYLFHWPIYILMDYYGLKNSWYFLGGVFLFSIPANYIFDKILKEVFWKPCVDKLTIIIMNYSLSSGKLNKF